MRDSTIVTGRRYAFWFGVVLVLVFVVLRVAPFVGANIGRGVDSLDYRAAARLPLFSREFLGGPRPFGYPLFLKLVRHNEHAAVVLQMLVDSAAWLALAWMAARVSKTPAIRVTAALVVLALGASLDMIQWDRVLSSEALSTAFGVGLLAALLWMYERWTWPRLAVVAVLSLAATIVRDSNGTFLGVVAIVLLIGVSVRRLRVRVLALVAIFAVVAALGSTSASAGKRWQGPLKDVITLRLLESPERTAYLRQRGMPLTPAEIEAARGHCVVPSATPPTACVVLLNPAFYQWINQHGRGVYVDTLAKFPATTLWEPVAHLRDSVGTRVRVELPLAADTAERAPVSRFLDAVFFIRNPLLLVLWALGLIVLALVAFVRGVRGVYVVGVALVGLVYPHLWLVWVGGALEVARHSLLASVQLRVGLWLGSLWLLDAFLTRSSLSEDARSSVENRHESEALQA